MWNVALQGWPQLSVRSMFVLGCGQSSPTDKKINIETGKNCNEEEEVVQQKKKKGKKNFRWSFVRRGPDSNRRSRRNKISSLAH